MKIPNFSPFFGATVRRRWRPRFSNRKKPPHPFAPFLFSQFVYDCLTPEGQVARVQFELESRYIAYFGESNVWWSADDMHPFDAAFMEVLDDADYLASDAFAKYSTEAWRWASVRAMFQPWSGEPEKVPTLADVPVHEQAAWLSVVGCDASVPGIDEKMATRMLADFVDAQALHLGNDPVSRLNLTCLHITRKRVLATIMREGLLLKMGRLSKRIESHPGVYLFPNWECMEDAQWLLDNWPYDSEPVLLAVNTRGLQLETQAAYEVVSRQPISANRIVVLRDSESGWDADAGEQFKQLGGRLNDRTIVPTCTSVFV